MSLLLMPLYNSIKQIKGTQNTKIMFMVMRRAASSSSTTTATATVRAVKRRLTPTRAALTLTPSAVERVKEIVSSQSNCVGLKIGMKQRGCNGLSYTLDHAFEKDPSDEEVRQDGVVLYIDKRAQLSILGTEMDYVTSKLSSEFVFNNPNITGTCGCGESFSI